MTTEKQATPQVQQLNPHLLGTFQTPNGEEIKVHASTLMDFFQELLLVDEDIQQAAVTMDIIRENYMENYKLQNMVELKKEMRLLKAICLFLNDLS